MSQIILTPLMCHRRTDPMILIETEAADFRFSILIFGEQINDPLIFILFSVTTQKCLTPSCQLMM